MLEGTIFASGLRTRVCVERLQSGFQRPGQAHRELQIYGAWESRIATRLQRVNSKVFPLSEILCRTAKLLRKTQLRRVLFNSPRLSLHAGIIPLSSQGSIVGGGQALKPREAEV